MIQIGGAKIGDIIVNFNDPTDVWGKIIAKDNKVWRLESGRTAKIINEGTVWKVKPVSSDDANASIVLSNERQALHTKPHPTPRIIQNSHQTLPSPHNMRRTSVVPTDSSSVLVVPHNMRRTSVVPSN
jgi:hypothetical protein